MPQFKYDDAANKILSADTRKRLAAQIKDDINDFCVKEFTDEPRTHLGGSVIGHECARHTWYAWRWVKQEKFSGRMLRLFNRGHLEEIRFVKWLRGIGCEVWEVAPEILHYHPESESYFLKKEFDPGDGLIEDVTDNELHEFIAASKGIKRKQFRIYGVHGHYGGALDGVSIIPYLPDLPVLAEFKTHNTKSFCNLVEKGLQIAKPVHFSQMSAYGKEYNFKYGMYVATNKNDDDIHVEIVELDWNLADQLKRKAELIITSQVPPPKLSMQPSFWKCKDCFAHDICHYDAPVEKNCRSCINASAVEEKQWYCKLHGQNIPPEFIKDGCDQHHPIVNAKAAF